MGETQELFDDWLTARFTGISLLEAGVSGLFSRAAASKIYGRRFQNKAKPDVRTVAVREQLWLWLKRI